MKKSEWTNTRLTRLYHRYNRKYWRGRLPEYEVTVSDLSEEEAVGMCIPKDKSIKVDIAQHENDREIRSTLLHEMAHAAARKGKAHGEKFWEQIEHLLKQGASIDVGFQEAPGLRSLESAIPRRLKLCRKAARKADARRERRIRKHQKEHPDVKEVSISDKTIIQDFGRAAWNCTWLGAYYDVGTKYSLLDVEGRPRDRRAARIIKEGKKVHRRVRREYLEEKRLRELWEARDAQPE